MRDFIVNEIKRVAAENGDSPPGRNAFVRATGITAAKWRGVTWLRWSDALAEAGLAPNEWNQKLDSRKIIERLAALCRKLGRLPTHSEVRMERQLDPEFPAHSTISNHFRSNIDRAQALRQLASDDDRWSDLLDFLPEEPVANTGRTNERQEGMVYLLKSGKHYKIDRSDDIERRFREVTIALPESVMLVHAIRTDDTSGIEAYWHRRFADKRANGEWFALTGDDVRAFRKRTYQ